MEVTQRFGLPLLIYGQGQKDVTHNEAVVAIDCLLHGHVESAGLSRPPANPEVGAAWLVGSPAEEEWSGHEGELACLTSAGWRFFVPVAGFAVWNAAIGRSQRFDGVDWRLDPKPALTVPVRPPLAGGPVVDVQARAALEAIVARLVDLGVFSAS